MTTEKSGLGVDQEGSTASSRTVPPEEVAIVRRTCEELARAFESIASAYDERSLRAANLRSIATDCRGAIHYGWLSILETLPATEGESASVVLAVDRSWSTPKRS